MDKNVANIMDKNVANIMDKNVANIMDKNVANIMDKNVANIMDKNVDNIMDKNVANIMDKNVDNIMDKNVANIMDKNVDKITVNNKNYTYFRYTTDKAIVVSTDSYHFIHVQHNGLTGNNIKKIIVNALLTQSFQDINSIAKNSDLFHIYNIVVNPDNLLFNDNYLEELKKFLRKDSIAY